MQPINRMLSTILLLMITFCCNAQDTIYWKKKQPLTWADFKGKPSTNNAFLASSTAGITYTVLLRRNDFIVVAKAYFVPSNSWKKYRADSTLLKHEQGHFDITEIFARKINLAAKQIKPGEILIENAAKKMADKWIDEKNKTQLLYDNETKNGTNNVAQLRWLQWIENELEN